MARKAGLHELGELSVNDQDGRKIQLTDGTHEDGSAVGINFTPKRLELCIAKRHRTSEQPSDSEMLAPFCS